MSELGNPGTWGMVMGGIAAVGVALQRTAARRYLPERDELLDDSMDADTPSPVLTWQMCVECSRMVRDREMAWLDGRYVCQQCSDKHLHAE